MPQHATALVLNSECVRCVVDDFEVVDICNLLNCFCVAWMSVAVNGHNGSSLWRNCSLNLRGIQIKGICLNVNKNGLNPVPKQGMGGSYKRIGSCNYLSCNAQCL